VNGERTRPDRERVSSEVRNKICDDSPKLNRNTDEHWRDREWGKRKTRGMSKIKRQEGDPDDCSHVAFVRPAVGGSIHDFRSFARSRSGEQSVGFELENLLLLRHRTKVVLPMWSRQSGLMLASHLTLDQGGTKGARMKLNGRSFPFFSTATARSSA